MACMCGDTHCSSCGPAQGNWKCVLCGAWADDCCEHIDEETGQYKEEFKQQVEAAHAAEAEAIAAEWAEREKLEKDIEGLLDL